jgi:hypothetical protein
MARHDYLLRTVVLGVQVLCMCITVVLAVVVFKQRKCKVREPAVFIPSLM